MKMLLNPPTTQSAEEWLLQFDNRPSVLPRWPASARMTLVVVAVDMVKPDSESTAYVLEEPVDANEFCDKSAERNDGYLFFTVLKSEVLPFCEPAVEDSQT